MMFNRSMRLLQQALAPRSMPSSSSGLNSNSVSGEVVSQRRTPIVRDLLIEALQHPPSLREQISDARRLALIETLTSLTQSHTTTNSHVDSDVETGGTAANDEDENATGAEGGDGTSESVDDVNAKAVEIILDDIEKFSSSDNNNYLTKEQFQNAVRDFLHSSLSSSSSSSPSFSSDLQPDTVNAMAEKILNGNWEDLLALTSNMEQPDTDEDADENNNDNDDVNVDVDADDSTDSCNNDIHDARPTSTSPQDRNKAGDDDNDDNESSADIEEQLGTRMMQNDETPVAADCTICLGPLDHEAGTTTLPSCQHAFCKACISSWITSDACRRSNTSASCPTCRTPIEDEKVIEIVGYLPTSLAPPPLSERTPRPLPPPEPRVTTSIRIILILAFIYVNFVPYGRSPLMYKISLALIALAMVSTCFLNPLCMCNRLVQRMSSNR